MGPDLLPDVTQTALLVVVLGLGHLPLPDQTRTLMREGLYLVLHQGGEGGEDEL